ncbi:MAG TPA: hypothetical protein VD865_08945 [Stenotrophomonas sp.]|nr:hypothetical protein [Stenotrophomonas sp.]
MTNFSVDFVSPVEYENLAAEVSYAGQLLCRIRTERPDFELELEYFFDFRLPVVPLVIPFAEFMELVSEVAEEVRALRQG